MGADESPDYGGALMSGVKSILTREFGITPIPQVVKPLIEVGMNRNFFFDRDIEPLGTQGRSPSMRYGKYTSETAIVAARGLEYSPFDIFNLSPYQLEHLINGYFESFVICDILLKSSLNFFKREKSKFFDLFTVFGVFE